MRRYKITVKTFKDVILTFSNISEYEDKGSFIRFKDSKTAKIKQFPSTNCEIEEVDC